MSIHVLEKGIVERQLALARKLHDEWIKNWSARFKFEAKADGLVMSLHATLIEYSAAFVTLVEKNRHVGATSVLRSFVEAYVDLTNLNADPSYQDSMLADYHEQWIRVLRASGDVKNTYLHGIADVAKDGGQLRWHEMALEDLRKKSIKPLTKAERFERADMTSFYRSIYNFLCAEAHNDIRALIARHLSRGKESGSKLVGYKLREARQTILELELICGLLFSATYQIHLRLKTDCGVEMGEVEEELKRIREQLDQAASLWQ
ncbi:MAG: DUF5677 domain-containing protein [Alphaproteobacteria bacterium]